MRSILCYGDSNTYGTPPMTGPDDKGRFDAALRWPGEVWRLLSDGVRLIEEGLPGRTTVHDDPIEGAHKNGLAVLPAILESHRPLDIVVMMLGTNDMKARYAVTAEDVASSVDRLLRAIQGAEAGPDRGVPKVLVVAPPPIVETGCLAGMFRGGAAKSEALAPLIEAAATARGARFLDAGRHISVSPIDGVHFDAAAHAELGRAIGSALCEMLD